MSTVHELITIEPPIGLAYPGARTEHHKSKIYTCTVCFGQGGHWHDQHSVRGEGWKICNMCKGTGSIQANITQEWVSVGEVKEQFKTDGE